MATDPPADLELAPLNGQPQTLEGWLTMFHLVVVVLDPFTHESAWILKTVARILRIYDEADCRVALLVTASPAEARMFLGPYADEFLTFADPDRTAVKALDLERLPALVHIRQDRSLAGASEGWNPPEWKAITENLSRAMRWTKPVIPAAGDPAPYEGTPAAG
ncbi:MAG: hypothetical protein ACRDJP_15635 [Actinomycetota bacterium]